MTRWSAPYRLVMLAIANLLIPAAVLLFATGFFPYKPFLPGLAQYDSSDGAANPAAPFDRVIFMVVDALRSDFVFGPQSGFNYTQKLIRSGTALPFTAHATSPTITMPRVKALTTGSIPSFLDVILNFAESDTTSSLDLQDTWLAQMKAKKGGRLVMYGDDTWLKLFPHSFARADGTSSFFVSDFTEVDNNVTRHVTGELRNDDWNTMILHYLGLDHIGHKAGPRSPNMIPKQHEMDEIVREVYEAMLWEPHLQSTLLVMCGDHGMNDAGNHGGSAPGETSPALVLISPKIQSHSTPRPCPTEPEDDFQYYTVIEQSDIVPTLAGLLGFPIPLNNLGLIIPEVLKFWPSVRDQEYLLSKNAEQMLRLVQATFPNAQFIEQNPRRRPPSSDLERLEGLWSDVLRLRRAEEGTEAEDDARIVSALRKFSKSAQELMSTTASNYDLTRLGLGVTVAAVSALAASIVLRQFADSITLDTIAVVLVSVTYGLMMFGSSYVEEEQHFWYWSAAAWLWILLVQDFRRPKDYIVLTVSWLIPYTSLRLITRWNQTGQKFAGSSDIAGTILPQHTTVLWLLVIATYVDVLRRVLRRGLRHASTSLSLSAAGSACLSALWFKLAFTVADAPELLQGLPPWLLPPLTNVSLTNLANTTFLWVWTILGFGWWAQPRGENLAARRYALSSHFHDVLTLFLITQTRLTNIPLFLLFEFVLRHISASSPDLTVTQLSLTTLLLQRLAFFAMGGSNAISSIDLSNAYNGVSGYNVLAVGFLTFVSNWAGPIWWTSALNLLLVQRRPEYPKAVPSAAANNKGKDRDLDHSDSFSRHITVHTVFSAISIVFVMAACTALRTHLFIWTVFSPKYLYTMAWSLGQHLGVTVGFGWILWVASRS